MEGLRTVRKSGADAALVGSSGINIKFVYDFFQYTFTLFILDGWMDLHHHVFDTSMYGLGEAGGYVEAGSAYASSPPPSIPAFCALHGTDLASPVQGCKMRHQ